MKGLRTLTQTDLLACVQQAQAQAIFGRVADRIPLLAKANPDWFAAHICYGAGQQHSLGDTACVFPLMSVIKPFVLLYLLELLGDKAVFQRVGVEPSEAPFNSLEQLIADRGQPRNPMINSGAIVLAEQLPGQNATDRCQQLCQWLNQQANCRLQLDEAMLASVRSAGREPNQAIANYLIETGHLENLETTLDTYEQICCLSSRVEDLANLGALLSGKAGLLASQYRQIVNALMLTCGLYEASGAVAVQIGLPIKSGISGGLLAVVPGQGAIACYSPNLDRFGNSVVGLAFVEALSKRLQLSIFN